MNISHSASTVALQSQASPKLPAALGSPAEGDVRKATELKEAFSQFVGETFYSQMLKSMRQTVGEPAYFHGGMAEEQFQARLDQQMAADMASGQGAGLAESLFEHQFPAEAQLLRDAEAALAAEETAPAADPLDQLSTLRRR